jgi:hypothetical protein
MLTTPKALKLFPKYVSNNASRMVLTAKPGEYWYYKINGQLWPVVVIKQSMVPNQFESLQADSFAIPVFALGRDTV